MFGKKETPKSGGTGRPTSAPGNALNSLVQGTVITGDIKAPNDLRIDGTVEGNVHCDARLIIGPAGSISGEVICQNAMIEGTFSGNIRVQDTLNIREQATVEGEVRYGKLIVQPGAKLNGDVRMNGSGGNGSVKPGQAKAAVQQPRGADGKIARLEKARN